MTHVPDHTVEPEAELHVIELLPSLPIRVT